MKDYKLLAKCKNIYLWREPLWFGGTYVIRDGDEIVKKEIYFTGKGQGRAFEKILNIFKEKYTGNSRPVYSQHHVLKCHTNEWGLYFIDGNLLFVSFTTKKYGVFYMFEEVRNKELAIARRHLFFNINYPRWIKR